MLTSFKAYKAKRAELMADDDNFVVCPKHGRVVKDTRGGCRKCYDAYQIAMVAVLTPSQQG